MKIRLIVATRLSEEEFFTKAATGRSLLFNNLPFLEVRLFANNLKGLPEIYNQVILESITDPAILIFAHDDLHIIDFFWLHRIIEGLSSFNVLGLAGNRRRIPNQPSWAFIDTNFTWDQPENLSGAVGHGTNFPPANISIFGQPRQKVLLLDGLLLAANSKMLVENNLFFDERFKFHFYDLDFCRQAELKNISCGTWDISLIHESGGSFGSSDWQSSYHEYLNKWGE